MIQEMENSRLYLAHPISYMLLIESDTVRVNIEKYEEHLPEILS